MALADRILYPARCLIPLDVDEMARSLIHAQLMTLFGGWSTSRVARFLEVNARTVQRWMRDNEGQIPSREVPDDVQMLVRRQQQIIDDIELERMIADVVETAQANEVHPEVLGAHLARAYKRATGREVE